jgi:hypothetical protein
LTPEKTKGEESILAFVYFLSGRAGKPVRPKIVSEPARPHKNKQSAEAP